MCRRSPTPWLDTIMQKQSAGVLDAISVLEAEEARLAQELDALKSAAEAVGMDLKRVRASLAALKASDGRTSRGDAGKGGLADAVALEVILRVLAAGPMTADALKAKLLEHVQASGLSGTGVHLVLRRVLKDRRFQETKDGYGLLNLSAASA